MESNPILHFCRLKFERVRGKLLNNHYQNDYLTIYLLPLSNKMSAKNKLQEYCQRHGYSLPEYICVREGGKDHSPQWRGQVNCIIGGKEYFFESNNVFISAKDATKQAAQQALDHIDSSGSGSSSGFIHSTRKERRKKSFRDDVSHTFILLDLENVPHSYRDLCENFTLLERVSIVGFYSQASGHIRIKVEREIERYGVNIHLVEAYSDHSDAADIEMCVWVGSMMSSISLQLQHGRKSIHYSPKINIRSDIDFYLNTTHESIPTFPIRVILITGDHFGKSLVESIGYKRKDSICPEIEWQAQLYNCIDEITK